MNPLPLRATAVYPYRAARPGKTAGRTGAASRFHIHIVIPAKYTRG
jgi:hypothetical protein